MANCFNIWFVLILLSNLKLQFAKTLSRHVDEKLVPEIFGIENPPISYPLVLRKSFSIKQSSSLSRYIQCDQFTQRRNPNNYEMPESLPKSVCLLNSVRFPFETKPWKCLIHFVIPVMLNDILWFEMAGSRKTSLQIFSDFSTKSERKSSFLRISSVLPSTQSSLLIIASLENSNSLYLNDLLTKMLVDDHLLNQI